MKTFIKCIILFPILLLLAACAIEPQRQALSMQNQKKIQSSQAILNTAQNGIQVQANNWFSSNKPDPYAPMDSGYIVRRHSGMVGPDLISDMIVSAVENHDANKSTMTLASTRNELHNFNYINSLKNNLNKKLSALSWLKLKNIKVKYNIHRTAQQIVDATNQNSILFVGTTYYLNSTFERLEVVAYVRLDEKSKNGKSPSVLYKNNFYYIYRLKSNNKKENILVWKKNNAALLKSKLGDASSMLSTQIADDINNSNLSSGAAQQTTVSVMTIDGIKDNANIISKKDGYYVLSLVNGGAIYIVNQLS